MFVPRKSDLHYAAKTIAGEARGEPYVGQLGVAWVIINRVRADLWGDKKPDWWGEGVEAVCLKRAQFSCWNVGDKNRQFIDGLSDDAPEFLMAAHVYTGAFLGLLPDNTGGATHYHRRGIRPSWSIDVEPTCTLNNHIFYRAVEPGLR